MTGKTFAIAAMAFAAGYICGSAASNKKHLDWQKSHQFQCWKPKKTPDKPGDYPQVFVIDKRGAKE